MQRALALLLLMLTLGNTAGFLGGELEFACAEDCEESGANDCCPPACHVSCCGGAMTKGLPPADPTLPVRFATTAAGFGAVSCEPPEPPTHEILHVPRSLA